MAHTLCDGAYAPLLVVEDAPGAGRGAFATRDIRAGETVLIADDLTVHALFREYRGEVCWNCFAYNRGERLAIRDAVHGFAFCSEACRLTYTQQCDDVGLRARAAVEKLVKMKGARREKSDELVDRICQEPRPTGAEIETAWKRAEADAAVIRNARVAGQSGAIAKAERQVLQRALSAPASPDILTFQLSAVLMRYNESRGGASTVQWPHILELEPDTLPYVSAGDLGDYVTSYLHLLAVLPEELLTLVTAEMLHTVKTREVHNSFGIRSLGDEGSEFFGYGVWPSASYFNHCCAPNLRRKRVGRAWLFSAKHDIGAGSQLYISYLSGEDVEVEALSWRERSRDLKRTWGFGCACDTCRSESANEK